MSQLPCLYCDGPIPISEAERASLCPLCSRPLTVCGRYRLRQLLSKSETDRVYAAEGDGKSVAVKVFLARDDDWATISEFERMGRTLQASKNTSAPQIFGWEKGGQGRLIIVRERCDGGTLEDRLRSGKRPDDAVLRGMLEGLLSVLAETHRLTPPLLHRDIRPSNILFRETNSWLPVLVDFDPRAGGNPTPTTDLSSLGRSIEATGGLRSFVERLANGGFASADQALSELRRGSGPSVAPSLRPQPGVTPPRPQAQPRRTWVWVLLGILVALGMIGRLSKKNKQNSHKPPTVAQKETTSDVGDATVEGYRKECEKGKARGCYNLGYRYEKGKGIRKDVVRAANLYEQSCEMGDILGCNNLGVLYETGNGVPKNVVKAAQLYTRACDKKDYLACRNLGYMYSNGLGVEQNAARAVELYQLSCDHDEIKGCYNLGVLYETAKGVPADYIKALALYQRACDGKDYAGCTNLGWMYAQGKGVPVDQTRARGLYETACNNGDVRGCNNLGVIYEKGREVDVDFTRAFGLYLKACNGDDYYGCGNLGFFYETGKGTSKNLNRATELYQKACKLGYDKGCQYFNDMVKDSRTRKFALGLLERGCAAGDSWSCDQQQQHK
jgi:uncharacterized protein